MNRILIVDNSVGVTGASKSIQVITKRLTNKYDFFYAVPIRFTRLRNESNIGFTYTTVNFVEISKSLSTLFYPFYLVLNTIKILNLIRKNHIQIIHINDLYNMVGVLAKVFRPKLKLVYHVRLLPSSYVSCLYPFWKKLVSKFADDIICVSEVVSRNFDQTLTTIIYDSIEPKRIPLPVIKKQTLPVNIIYVSNYIRGKGQAQALKAFALALQKLDKVHLSFYGGTLQRGKNLDYKHELEDLASQLNIEQFVAFEDTISSPEAFIAEADLMLNFSESESFSMTTLEALVYGTPIIATACGGPSEIIEHERSGLLVPVNDIEKMAGSIELLVNDFDLRKTFIANGLQRATSRFNLNDQKDKLDMVYTRLLNKGKSY